MNTAHGFGFSEGETYLRWAVREQVSSAGSMGCILFLRPLSSCTTLRTAVLGMKQFLTPASRSPLKANPLPPFLSPPKVIWATRMEHCIDVWVVRVMIQIDYSRYVQPLPGVQRAGHQGPPAGAGRVRAEGRAHRPAEGRDPGTPAAGGGLLPPQRTHQPAGGQVRPPPRRPRTRRQGPEGQGRTRQEADHRAAGGDRRPARAAAEGQPADRGTHQGQHQPQAADRRPRGGDPGHPLPAQGGREQEPAQQRRQPSPRPQHPRLQGGAQAPRGAVRGTLRLSRCGDRQAEEHREGSARGGVGQRQTREDALPGGEGQRRAGQRPQGQGGGGEEGREQTQGHQQLHRRTRHHLPQHRAAVLQGPRGVRAQQRSPQQRGGEGEGTAVEDRAGGGRHQEPGERAGPDHRGGGEAAEGALRRPGQEQEPQQRNRQGAGADRGVRTGQPRTAGRDRAVHRPGRAGQEHAQPQGGHARHRRELPPQDRHHRGTHPPPQVLIQYCQSSTHLGGRAGSNSGSGGSRQYQSYDPFGLRLLLLQVLHLLELLPNCFQILPAAQVAHAGQSVDCHQQGESRQQIPDVDVGIAAGKRTEVEQQQKEEFDQDQQSVLQNSEEEVLLVTEDFVVPAVGKFARVQQDEYDEGGRGVRAEVSEHQGGEEELGWAEEGVAGSVVVRWEVVLRDATIEDVLEFVEEFGVFVLVVLLAAVESGEDGPAQGAEEAAHAQDGVESSAAVTTLRVLEAVELDEAAPHHTQKLVAPDLVSEIHHSARQIINHPHQDAPLLSKICLGQQFTPQKGRSCEPQQKDDVGDDDGVHLAAEVDVLVEEGEANRTILHHVAQPLVLHRAGVAGEEEVEVLEETQSAHHVPKGQRQVVSSDVHMQEHHLQTKHQFLHNDAVPHKNSQEGKNNSYPAQHYEEDGKIVDTGELIGGKSIEAVDTRGCDWLQFGGLQETRRRDPVEGEGSIDEAGIDSEKNQERVIHLLDRVYCVLILAEFIDAGSQLAASLQTHTLQDDLQS